MGTVKRRRMHSKGMLRTLEAVMAFILTFTFLVIISKPAISPDSDIQPFGVLIFLESDDEFRECAFVNDEDCLTTIIADYLPRYLEYRIVVDSPFFPPEDQEVIAESLFLVLGQTKVYKTVKLYYWLTLDR